MVTKLNHKMLPLKKKSLTPVYVSKSIQHSSNRTPKYFYPKREHLTAKYWNYFTKIVFFLLLLLLKTIKTLQIVKKIYTHKNLKNHFLFDVERQLLLNDIRGGKHTHKQTNKKQMRLQQWRFGARNLKCD